MTIEATAPEVEGRLAAVPEVRSRARGVLGRWGLGDDDIDDTLYVLTELTANAARHSPPGMHHVSLHLSPDGGSVVVEVHDQSRAVPYIPADAAHNPVAEYGRGLLIVAELAANWGHQQTSGGKKVWAEMRLSSPVAPPPPHYADRNAPAKVLRRAAVIAALHVERLFLRRPAAVV
ncbi:ATP-binding protein [Kitasatospora cineracea]|uniref:ATP-binding protein n=1 Tax=Kitasatospora cineracea TaxID=88074 RepID=UPI0034299D72